MENNLITEIFDLDAIKRQIADTEQLSTKLTAVIKANVEEVKRAQNEASNAKGVADTEKAIDNLKNSTKELSEANSQLSKVQKELNTLKEKEAFLLTDEGKKLSAIVEAQKRANKEKNEALLLADALAQATQKEVKSISDAQTKIAELQKALKQCNLTTKEGKDAAESYKNEISKLNGFIKENTTVIDQQKRNVSVYKDVIAGLEAGERTLGDAISKTKEELEKMELQRLKGIDFTKEQTAEYYKLQGALAQMTKAQQEVSTKTQVLTTNYIGLKSTIEKLKLGANVLTSLSAATALLGGDSEKLNSIMQKVIATQQILNTVTQIQEQLSSRSIISLEAQKVALEGVATSTAKVSAKTGLFGTALTKLGTGVKSFFSIFKGGNIIIAAFTAAIALATKMIKDNINATKEYEKRLKEDRARREYIATLEAMEKKTKELKTQTEQTTTAITNFDEAIVLLNTSTANGIALNNDFFNSIVRQGMASKAKKAVELMNEYLLLQDKLKDSYTPGGEDEKRVKEIEEEMGNLMIAMINSKKNAEDLIKVLSGGSIFGAQTPTLSYFQKIMEMAETLQGTTVTPPPPSPTTAEDPFEKEKAQILENYNYRRALEGDSYALREEEIKALLALYKKYGKNTKADLTEILKLKKELSQINIEVADDNYEYRLKKINDEYGMQILTAETLNAEGKANIDINDLKIEQKEKQLRLDEKYLNTLKEQGASAEKIAEVEKRILETKKEIAELRSKGGEGSEYEITDAGILSGRDRKKGKKRSEEEDKITLLQRVNEEYGGILDAISEADSKLGEKLWKNIGKVSDELKKAGVDAQSFMDTLNMAGASANKLYEQGLSTLLGNMSTAREEAFAQQKEAIAENLKLTNEWLDENVTNSEQRERMKEIAQKEADKKSAELQYQQKVREQNQAAVMAIIDGISAGMKALLNSIKDYGTAGIAMGMAQLAIAAGTGVAQAGLIKAQKIPRYEKGTDYAVGGLALVGEAGREIIQTRDGATLVEQPSIVNLSPGDKVYPNMETEKILSRQSITNNYNSGSEITVEADTFKITEETSKSLKKRKLINKRLNLKF